MKSSNNSQKLAYSLEKIAKVLSERIRDRDLFDIAQEIKWLNETLTKIFDLEETDYERFRDIIDPFRWYNPVEPINWKNIKPEDIQIEKRYQTDPSKKFVHRIGESEDQFRKTFFETFINTLFELWKSSIGSKEFLLASEIQLMYMNLLSHVIHLDAKKFDHRRFIEESLNAIYLINLDIVNFSTNDWECDFVYDIGVSKPLDSIYRDGFKVEVTSLFFKLVFSSVSLLHSKYPKYVVRYISQLTDGSYTERWTSFPSSKISRLQIMVSSSNLPSKRKERLKDLLISIRPESVSGLRDLKSLYKVYNNLDEISRLIIESSEFSKVLSEKDILELKTLIAAFFKSYQMRLNVIQVLAFVLFHKDYKTLKDAYHYNQPYDSGATWSNRDVVPFSVKEICNFISDELIIENNLLGYWSGHHGIAHYLARLQFLSISNHLNKVVNSSYQNFSSYIKSQYKDDYQVINVFLHKFSALFELSKYLEKDFINELDININKTTDCLSSIRDELQTFIDTAPTRVEITKNKVFPFVDRVINGFKRKSLIANIFPEIEDPIEEEIIKENIQFGFIQSVPKTYFIDSWHVSLLDYEEVISREFSVGFDLRCYQKLDNYLEVHDELHFTKLKELLLNELKNFDLWVFSVVSPAFIFHNDKEYKPDENDEESGFYRGIKVIKTKSNWYDRSVRLFKKEDLMGISFHENLKDYGSRNGVAFKTLEPSQNKDLERIEEKIPYSERKKDREVYLDFLVDATLYLNSDNVGIKVPVDID